MTEPVIQQADWEALTREYGRVAGELLVWKRVAAERDEEASALHAQLAALSDQLYRPPDDAEEGG